MLNRESSAVPSSVLAAEVEQSIFGRLDHQTAAIRLLAEAIARVGGVMVTPKPFLRCQLIGHLAWLGHNRVFWFEALGKTPTAAHTLEYDELCRAGHRGVVFFHQEQIVGYLCTIERAHTREAACMKAAHEWWAVIASRREDFICELCREAAPDPASRRCAWRKCGRSPAGATRNR